MFGKSSKKAAPLKIAFEVRLSQQVSSYEQREFAHVKVEETVPAGVNPVDHVRRRVAEEITRQSGNFHEAEVDEE
jgi:hypothetical protein